MENIPILNFLVDFFPWGFAKVAILLLLFMYVIFATVIVRQEQLMSRVVAISFSPALRLIGILHLLASIAIFFLTLLFL